MNKRLIDPVAPRHTAVTAAERVPLTLSDGPAVEEVQVVPRHKKNPALGSKVSVRSKVRRQAPLPIVRVQGSGQAHTAPSAQQEGAGPNLKP